MPAMSPADPHPAPPHPTWARLAGQELRAEWSINPKARRRARRWCTFLGIWGVTSGYACFLLWWHHPGKLAFAFVFFLLAALVIEAARDLLRHGEIEELRKPSAAKALAILLTAASKRPGRCRPRSSSVRRRSRKSSGGKTRRRPGWTRPTCLSSSS